MKRDFYIDLIELINVTAIRRCADSEMVLCHGRT